MKLSRVIAGQADSSRPPAIEISDAELQLALNRVVRDSLPIAASWLVALYAIFGICHLLVQSYSHAWPMVVTALASSLAMLIIRIVLKRWQTPLEWAQPLAALLAVFPWFNSLVTLRVLSEPQQTTNFMLLLIGVGLFFLSLRWMVGAIVVTWLSWSLLVWLAPPSPSWIHFGFALFSATVLALFIHNVRVRIIRRIETLRLVEEKQKLMQLRNERMLAMAQMATTLMHEINNPLSVIIGYAQVITQQPNVPSEVVNRLQKIEKMSIRIGEIVKQLDDFDDKLVEFGGVQIVDLRGSSEPEKEKPQLQGD